MTATVRDLATQVMFLLGKNDAQEEVSTEDYADIARVYRYKLAKWQMPDIDLAYWIENEIPDEALLEVAMVIADDVAPAFGMLAPMVMDDNGQPIRIGVKGLRDLKRLTVKQASGLPTVGVYFAIDWCL